MRYVWPSLMFAAGMWTGLIIMMYDIKRSERKNKK